MPTSWYVLHYASNTRKLTSGKKSATSTTVVMHLARITGWGESPKYLQVTAPECPSPESDKVQVRVSGAAVHKLVQLRVEGKHYSANSLPHIPGVDGVGVTANGDEVYFFTFGEGLGSYAEVVNVSKTNIFTLPTGAEKLQIAALVNPAMSSWMALRRRTVTLPENFSVLILGATSLSGTLAVPIARALGAGKVIGCARNQKKLDTLGLDQAIRLREPASETDFSSIGHVDVILDYVYGPPAAHLLTSLKSSRLVQYLNIGDLAAPQVVLHSKAMRSMKLLIAGSGVGSWTVDELRQEMPELLKVMAGFAHQKLNIVPLSQIETAWNQKSTDRTVFVP